MTSTRIFQLLKEDGHPGSVILVRRHVAKARANRPRSAYRQVEVMPGEQAQVDWGSFGHLRVGQSKRPLCCFVMVLSWSRVIFVDFSFDQRLDTFLRMHIRAFASFGGVPRHCVYDNLKSVVLHRAGSVVQFNPNFLQFAGHYLFDLIATPVRYPQAKGRVEAAIRYVRHSFFHGRSFSNLVDLRAAASEWCRDTANRRVHGATREIPGELLEEERRALHALPETRFEASRIQAAIVTKFARVRFDSNAYAVPPEYVGQPVQVRADDERVRIVAGTGVIAAHARCWDRRRSLVLAPHRDALEAHRRGKPSRRDRIANLSEDACRYLQEVARRRINLDLELRKLERLARRYGEPDVAAGLAAVLSRGTFGARYVRTLIDQRRFAAGQREAPYPIVTGRRDADEISVEPRTLEDYDDLF